MVGSFAVKTVVLGPPPKELKELIQRRRALGLDRFDEVWEGSYHMAPMARWRHGYLAAAVLILLHPYAQAAGLIETDGFNLGQPDNFRVPDVGYHREPSDAVYIDTAAIVVEILSPDDETSEKMPFFAAHHVDEIFIVDPDKRQVHMFALQGDHYAEAEQSHLLDLDSHTLEGAITWA